jgi:hypothetical protein
LETSGWSPWGESSFSLFSFMNATSSKDPSLLQTRPSLSTVSRNAVAASSYDLIRSRGRLYTTDKYLRLHTHTHTHIHSNAPDDDGGGCTLWRSSNKLIADDRTRLLNNREMSLRPTDHVRCFFAPFPVRWKETTFHHPVNLAKVLLFSYFFSEPQRRCGGGVSCCAVLPSSVMLFT